MIELDTSAMGPELANLLLLCGAGLAPLELQSRTIRVAKDQLERVNDDASLLGRANLADPAAAAGLRALLYLWCGWPSECAMYAQAAPENERAYLAALSARQAGRYQEAKESFRKVDRHPVFPQLAGFAKKTIGPAGDRALQRFKQIIELGDDWDPYAFIDLFELARADKLCEATARTVRTIQDKELELLFQRLYESATGEGLQVAVAADEENRRAERLRRERAVRRSRPARDGRTVGGGAVKAEPNGGGADSDRAGVLVASVQVRCPKCGKIQSFPTSARGTTVACPSCAKTFAVPAAAAPASTSPGTVGVRCPKCQVTAVLPESARGASYACKSCSAVFVVPQRRPAGGTAAIAAASPRG